MRATVAVIRIFFAALVVLLGLLACFLSVLIPQGMFVRLEKGWHRALAATLGVRLSYDGVEMEPGSLVVGNHISWLDIPLIGARWQVTFLSKSEISDWPVLGWIVRRAGTLFIKRGRGAMQAVKDIESVLRQGRSTVLFAEGTTTDGFEVRRFHSRLLQAALESSAPVQPMAIRYFDGNGRRTANPSYAGDVSLMQSVWRTACSQHTVAELTLFEAIAPDEERHHLARHAEELVRGRVMQGLPP